MCERLQGKTDAYSAIWNHLSGLEQNCMYVKMVIILIAGYCKAHIFQKILVFIINANAETSCGAMMKFTFANQIYQ